jgi:hypothetical protein
MPWTNRGVLYLPWFEQPSQVPQHLAFVVGGELYPGHSAPPSFASWLLVQPFPSVRKRNQDLDRQTTENIKQTKKKNTPSLFQVSKVPLPGDAAQPEKGIT